MKTIYIYGVIPTNDHILFEFEGFDEVYTIPHEGLAAVVSLSPLPDFSKLSQEEAVRYLLIHQQVTEQLMQSYSILPVKFGTVLQNETQVKRLLIQGQARLQATFQQLSGLMQMEVMVLWDLPQIFQKIGQTAEIIAQQAELAQASVAEQVAQKIALGQMVKVALEKRRLALQEAIKPTLQAIAKATVINPLMDDRMVLNLGLLLDEHGETALDNCLETIDQQFEGTLTLRCVGPLPPHSFATVSVEPVSITAIETARQQLGLAEQSTISEIKAAYHQQAMQHHPDYAPHKPSAADTMGNLTDAYNLLTTYALNQPPAGTNSHQQCDFRPQAVEETLLIRVI